MMRRTVATTLRVLRQLLHDPRTIVLLLAIPSVLLVIMYYVFNGESQLFQHFAPLLLGIFPFIIMFVVTSVATLRERTSGTLERVLTMPLRSGEFILGYAFAFAIMAFLQAGIATFITVHWLGITVMGGTARLLLLAVLAGVIGESLGLFVSAFASSEFQAVQFMPALVFPQLLTCGLFVDRDTMAHGLRWFADIMPLTYVADAAKRIATEVNWSYGLREDLLVISLYAIVILIASAATLRTKQ